MILKRLFFIFILAFGVHNFFLWLKPFGPLLSKSPYSTEIVDKKERLLRLSLSEDQIYRVKTDLNDISPIAIKATLLYEDRYFYWHFGVNPFAIIRAFWTTFVEKESVIGASTITMQLSRAIYDINSRSLLGKIEQIIRAFQIEFLYSKDDILEAYFNIVPYGFNIEGIGAASRIYFQKPPRRLSLLESLTLAVIPQSPYQRTKHIKRSKRVSKELKNARNRLFDQWLSKHPDNVEKKADFNLELDMRHPHELPFQAPHLVTEVLKYTNSGKVETSLDLSVQAVFEDVTRSYINQRKKIGIRNASALLVDTKTMGVLAYLGSADFFNNQISGQVNGVTARRSPGSALKPFAYGLALEQGLIHPLTMLKDAPTPFGTYTPDNFDRVFAGPLSTTDALIHSRNIPAILVAQELDKPTIYDFLYSLKIPLNPDPQHYGLSIVLGTAEVTMEELVQLYAMLNNEGIYRSISTHRESVPGEGKRALSKEVSFLILDMLSKNPKPDSESEDRWRLKPQSVAWKTGTSVGFRDAWAIGVFDHYVMAIWVGNFSGMGNSAFIGREAAGPLLFSLIEAFANIRDIEFSKPFPTFDMNLADVEFCALSGYLPHKDCPNRKRGWFMPGISPINHCKVHRRIEVDLITGKQVCPKFKGRSVTKVFEYWPTDLLKLFKQAGVGRRLPPPLHPTCLGNAYGDIDPKIISPKSEIMYHLRTSGSDSKKIPLLAIGDGNIKSLSWYIDNKFIGQSDTNDPLLWIAVAGHHNARVIDDQGRSSEIVFKVQWID